MRTSTFTKETVLTKLTSLLGKDKAKTIFDKHFASKFPNNVKVETGDNKDNEDKTKR